MLGPEKMILPDERALLLEVAAGSEAAFAALVKQYASLLYGYILKLTRDEAAAEDVVQEIFTQLWLTRETLVEVRHFRAFLFVISRNHALKALKRIDQEYAHREEWGRLNTIPEEHNDGIAFYLGLVEQAIMQLSPQQKKVWILSRRQGLKYNEIAQEMNISRETVKKYLQHATASIVTYLKSHGGAWIIAYLFSRL